MGAEARIQGYVARCGLGITRIRNQTVDEIPNTINEIFRIIGFLIKFINLTRNRINLLFIPTILSI
jgi:hypothetical protein